MTFFKKYWLLLVIYGILLLIFPAPVIGYSVVFLAFAITYKIGTWLGFGNCSSNDDDDLTNMMLFHHYQNKHKKTN